MERSATALSAGNYLDALSNGDVALPAPHPGTRPAWHLFVVRHPHRDALQRDLADAGIATQIHYPFAHGTKTGAFAGTAIDPRVAAGAEALCRQVLSLPIGPHLDDDQVDRVIAAVLAAGPHARG